MGLNMIYRPNLVCSRSWKMDKWIVLFQLGTPFLSNQIACVASATSWRKREMISSLLRPWICRKQPWRWWFTWRLCVLGWAGPCWSYDLLWLFAFNFWADNEVFLTAMSPWWRFIAWITVAGVLCQPLSPIVNHYHPVPTIINYYEALLTITNHY